MSTSGTTAIDHVRHLLRDRQTKDGARGTAEEIVCLDVGLLEERDSLQQALAFAESQQAIEQAAERDAAAAAEKTTTSKKRLSDPAPAVDDELDPAVEDGPEILELRSELDDLEEKIRASSLRLVFRSIGSAAYQQIVNRHPDGDDSNEARADYLNDVIGSCLKEVYTLAGEKLEGLTWDEIVQPDGPGSEGPLSYGEWEQLSLRVTALNRRKVDVPFSLRSSGKTPA